MTLIFVIILLFGINSICLTQLILREKVLSYIDNGGTVSEACDLFEVSDSSIHRWKRKKKATGTVDAKPRATGSYKLDEDKLQAYISSHQDLYLIEIASHFGVTVSCISKALSRLKITRKKSLIFTQNEMKQNVSST